MLQFLRFKRAGATRFALLALITILFSQPVLAAQQIGVTAALRGDVVRTASLQSGAAIGQMSSGQTVFLGDDIKVGNQGRLQVMLLDETVFTLGANSVMRIDEFVYDPADAANARLSTSITQGAFRFVSGQIAKSDRDAMKVNLPGATIGVRGTSVAGDVSTDGSASVILLGPAPNNALGLPAGAISVANEFGSVDINRPGFTTQLGATSQSLPPSVPVEATAEQMESVELSLAEQASAKIAEELGVDELEISGPTDTDGDGIPDSISGNAVLGKALSAVTGDGGVTSDNTLKAAVALTIFGESVLEMSDAEAGEFFSGVNLGGGIAELIENGDFKYLGPTQISELAGLTGSTTFTANNAAIEVRGTGENIGQFSTTQVWNFSTSNVSTTLDGSFSVDIDAGTVSGEFNNFSKTMSFANATGEATFNLNEDHWTQDGSDTVFAFHGVGGSYENGIDETVLLEQSNPAASNIMTTNIVRPDSIKVNVGMWGGLSNVESGLSDSPIAAFGETGVHLSVRNQETEEEILEAEGFVFGMDRQDSQ